PRRGRARRSRNDRPTAPPAAPSPASTRSASWTTSTRATPRRSIVRFAGNAQDLQLLVQRAARNAQAARGLLDATALFAAHRRDIDALHFTQGVAGVNGLLGRIAGVEHERVAVDHSIAGNERRALQDVLELADVARPGVVEQRLLGGGAEAPRALSIE